MTVDYLSADGNTYTVSVDLSDANIPEGAYLEVKELSDSEAEKYINQAAKAVDTKVKDLLYSKALDISIIYNNEKIQPDGNVRVEVTLQDKKKNIISEVVHFGDETEVLDSETVGKTVEFTTDGFSVFAIVGTSVLTTEHIDHNGYKYDVVVTYGPDAKIPEGSSLRVVDIENDTQEYENARNAVLANKVENGEVVDLNDFNLAALDISIISPDGVEIEPEATVQVDIRIKELPGVDNLNSINDTLEVQHHVETANGVVIETVFEGKEGSFDLKQDSEVIAEGKEINPNSVTNREDIISISELTEDMKSELKKKLQDDREAKAQQEAGTEVCFSTPVFSTFTITWSGSGSATDTTTTLRWRGGNSTRAYITVHYVDSEGNAITRPSAIGNNVDFTLNNGGTSNVDISSELAKAISGYTYLQAYYYSGGYYGNLYDITDITATRTNYTYYNTNTVTYYNNGDYVNSTTNSNAGDIFLVYSGSGTENLAKIHYGYMNGDTFVEFPDGKPEFTPNFENGKTHQQLYGATSFLIYDVNGYVYSKTYLNTISSSNTIPPMINLYNNQWRYRSGDNWTKLNNNDDIYVVYEPMPEATTGGNVEIDPQEEWPEGDDAPQFTKSSINNGNGTNTISLGITAAEKPVETQTKANVIVVFDRSGSMGEKLNGQTRLKRAQDAVCDMADALLSKNTSNNTVIKMGLVSFSTNATSVVDLADDEAKSAGSYKAKVKGLTADGGTNWEKALYLADRMAADSDAATFIVFVTDGDPTFRMSRGELLDKDLDMNASSTYTYYATDSVFGEGGDDSQGRDFDFAVEQVENIVSHNKNFYAIGVSSDVTKVATLCTDAGVSAENAFLATSSDDLENAFAAITQSIKSTLGFGDVEVTDGITALTNSEMKVMQTVDPNSFKYYRIVNGVKTEWTSREADGCAAATYDKAGGAVHWNMGETFQLENGVTYVVEFTVWPSQAAYDLVADLNNGIKVYAEGNEKSISAEERAQVVEVTAPTATTTGTYALKTNTEEVEATYNKTTKSGDVVSVSDTTDVKAEYHEGTLQNMSLDSDYITVKKVWHNALDSHVVDGITLTVTKDGAPYLDDVSLSDSNNWTSDEQYISTGFITKTSDGRYNVRETGHEYTVTEPAAFSYYWDLTADIYRPMVIDGTLTMLIKTDTPTGTEGTDYYVIGGNKYQLSTTTTPQLTASNDRRSNLNLKKVVTANTQAEDNVPNPDDVFKYIITVTETNGDDVWFGAEDTPNHTVPIEYYSANVTPEIKDGNPTGSYSVPSGEEFTISIKAGWNVRFFNLPKGTTYSIQETEMADGYEFIKAETSAEVTKPEFADDFQATPGTVNDDIVTGTIDQPNNVYSTVYTNNWNPNNEIVIIKTDENGDKLASAQFKLSKKADTDWTQIATFTSAADAGETLKVGHGLYKLEETTAPTDYYTTVGTIYFEVVTNGNSTTVTLTDENGAEITAKDLPRVYPDAAASGNEVTVKNWPLTTAEAQKAWKNADGTTTAPANATVVYTLYIDGEASNHTVTLDGTADAKPSGTDVAGYESAGWTATFINLPKYKFVEGVQTEIDYTIAETITYPGYTASTTSPVADGGEITNTQEVTSANAFKAWKNADGSTTAPEGAAVVFTLYADGQATSYTATLDGNVDAVPTGTAGYESAAWEAMFVNLPKYQAGTTTEIVYTIAETKTYPGYTPSTTDSVASGKTITNTQGSTETYAEKVWKNADGSNTAPTGASVVFTLYEDGSATKYTVTLDGTVDDMPSGTGGYESVAWTAKFVNLPESKIVNGKAVPIVYTIDETKGYPGYTADNKEPVGSGSKITNSQDTTSANALKKWVNADGTPDAPQGATVVFTLYADEAKTEYTVTLDGTADTAPEVTGGYESEAWKAEFVNLPKYKAGTATKIVYTVAETAAYPGYTASTTDPVASGATITNTQEKLEVNALKAWKNADGTATAPEGATVEFKLYADGTATDYTVTLDGTKDETVPTGTAGYESEAWKATFINLPKYKVVEGKAVEIVYTIGESKGYAGYTAFETEPVASGKTITNTQDVIEVYATKAWVNADNSTKAPEGATVVFTLLADGEATDHTVTLDGNVDTTVPTATGGYENEAWKATFVNLPKYQADGKKEIVYTIAETIGYESYEMDPKTAVASGGIITNKQIKTVIQIKKIGDWDVTKTLSGVQFKLYSDKACTNQIRNDSTGASVGTDGVITTGTDGIATIGALIAGTYYLQEVKAADGYKLLSGSIKFTIKTDGKIEYTTGNKDFDDATGAIYELKDGGYGIYINNPSGTALPLTGGPGTLPYTLGGFILMISALMYGFMMRRRERGLL